MFIFYEIKVDKRARARVKRSSTILNRQQVYGMSHEEGIVYLCVFTNNKSRHFGTMSKSVDDHCRNILKKLILNFYTIT